MTRKPRTLTTEETEVWRRVARTVKPIGPEAKIPVPSEQTAKLTANPPTKAVPSSPKKAITPLAAPRPARPQPLDRHGLDGSWERKLAKAAVAPDFTIDLHGHSLDSAHARLNHGLLMALAEQARVVLVITGRPRPVEAADRGSRRGAIRAKVLDWLALGPHGDRIATVRGAHPRHGGAGALYVVLRRARLK
jgi:DNA-nicking Smr family endonuclease